jgi:hypothetical protein
VSDTSIFRQVRQPEKFLLLLCGFLPVQDRGNVSQFRGIVRQLENTRGKQFGVSCGFHYERIIARMNHSFEVCLLVQQNIKKTLKKQGF